MQKFVDVAGKTIDAAINSALEQLNLSRDDVSVEVLDNPKSGFLGIGSQDAKVRVYYDVSKASKAQEFLAGLLDRMNISAKMDVNEDEEGNILINLTGDKMGQLIGRRGDTLDAVQRLTNFVINQGDDERRRVVIDTENYRKTREESLKRLAHKMAAKVIKIRRNLTLEPMNAYERHVIHLELQDVKGVSTYSTGTEPRRCVVVAFTPNKNV